MVLMRKVRKRRKKLKRKRKKPRKRKRELIDRNYLKKAKKVK